MRLKVTNARIAFAHGLFKASAIEEGQQEKFGADFILEADTKVFTQKADKSWEATTMDAAMLAVANDTWKGRGKEMLADLEASKKCYRDGNKRVNKSGEVYDGYEGKKYITAKSPTRPALFDRARQPLTEADGVIYSGCYGTVIFDLYGNSQPKKKGVFAGLTGVQFVRDGDAFGGGAPSKADDFDDLGDGADANDMV